MTNFTERETWLIEGADQINDECMPFERTHTPKYRVACGFPPRSRGGKVVGVCINASASEDNHFEVYINPSVAKGFDALEVLAHELCHVVDKMESGHRGRFARIARGIGLEGKLTATYAGNSLAKKLRSIEKVLGEYPHGSVNIEKTKKQSTRLVKVECEPCRNIARQSRSSYEKFGLICGKCGEVMYEA